MRKIFSICTFMLAGLLLFGLGNTSVSRSRASEKVNDTVLTRIVATDALGRKLSPFAGFKQDRYVGLFYFAWHGQFANQLNIRDITKLLREDPEALWSREKNDKAPVGDIYFFNEPLYGYYNAADPWVIRKHVELLIAAGVDFIAYDFTNSIIYEQPLFRMLETLNEYHENGWKVPQVMFFTKRNCQTLIPWLYKNIYEKNLYPHLWFYGDGDKPMIIAVKEDVPENIRDFFNIRHPQWPDDPFREDGFPYVEKVRPQRLYTNLISVSVAQHKGGAFSWSVKGPYGQLRPSWGRGYTSKNPENGIIEAIERGDNFQEQWDYAIEDDPPIVFVTGWNEWVAHKQVKIPEDNYYGDVPYWVDTFNTEFSRDIEMTKARRYVLDENGKYIEEGYGDNFYIQLIDNIRRYKGIEHVKNSEPVSKTINITGNPDQWNDVDNIYLNISTQKVERNFYDHTNRGKYYQAVPDNFIKVIKCTHDKNNVYFYLETDKDISAYEEGRTNWMNLFIGIQGSKDPSWESYHYVINRHPSRSVSSLEKSTGGYNFEKIADIRYSIQGNVMQIEIPRKLLGVGKGDFSIYFKASDSIDHEDDIMDYYVSGESVPMGRLSYVYSSNGSFADETDNAKSLSVLNHILLALSAIMTGAGVFLLTRTFKTTKEEKNERC